MSEERLVEELEGLLRGAAFDSGALELLYAGDRNITVRVMTGAAWEALVEAERGPEVLDLVRAQLEGYRMALDVATGRVQLSEAWLRSLHEVVCEPQATYRALTAVGWQELSLPKGEYKRQPNHVLTGDGSFHAYAPVDLVSSELHRLVAESRAVGAAHPAVQGRPSAGRRQASGAIRGLRRRAGRRHLAARDRDDRSTVERSP